MIRTEVLVPLKGFSQAKRRLAATHSSEARRRLATAMASIVLAAAKPLPTWVVSDDPEVAAWAEGKSFGVLSEPADGLNAAVQQAVLRRTRYGATRVIVAHGDLPLARSFIALSEVDGVRIVADRASGGTKVISLPTGAEFKFQYGAASALRHKAEAERLKLPVTVVSDPELSLDINTEADLRDLHDNHLAAFHAIGQEVATAMRQTSSSRPNYLS